MRALILASVLVQIAAPAFAGKVEMCVDPSCAKKIKREKLDCKIHKNKARGLTIGFKIGVPFASAGPEIGFARSSSINWNSMSQELIRRYEELCDMHNKGHLSVAEFNERYAKLDGLHGRAKDLKGEIEDTVYGRSDKAFSDLDKESSKHDGAGELKERVGELAKRIDDLNEEVTAAAEPGKSSS